ncbi:MAG: AmmeMemoRadiSam system protein A [Bacillota bacterium]|nr:AmmeMemoRadiSam system protein A [Bacillota bacterium]
MAIVGACMVPHPPMIIPEIGQGSEKKIRKTIAAYEKTAEFVADCEPDTIVLASPHSVQYLDYFHISPGYGADGDFEEFGVKKVKFHVDYDVQFTEMLSKLAREAGIPAGTRGEKFPALDHGTMVPLYFINPKCPEYQLVRIGLSGETFEDHYRLGMLIRDTAEILGRRVFFVASGDLSHKLRKDGPYGFDPAGPVYDERIMDVMGRGAFDELLDFDENFCNRAAECGHRSFVMMAGALDRTKVRVKKLVHQDVTGVGYGICVYRAGGEDLSRDMLERWLRREKKKLHARRKKEDPYVQLARKAVEEYVRGGNLDDEAASVWENLTEGSAGVFVSIHKKGRLRGCIGTTSAVKDSIAEEISANARSACSADPRFEPVKISELEWLDYSVDVLGKTERIESPEELDVKRYGVIVTKGNKRGLLLPNLDGVDTVRRQIEIAKQKAGIDPKDRDVQLERFEVVRHY